MNNFPPRWRGGGIRTNGSLLARAPMAPFFLARSVDIFIYSARAAAVRAKPPLIQTRTASGGGHRAFHSFHEHRAAVSIAIGNGVNDHESITLLSPPLTSILASPPSLYSSCTAFLVLQDRIFCIFQSLRITLKRVAF